MRACRTATVFILATLASSPAIAQEFVRSHRLSDRVLVLTEDSPMENIIVAIASTEGLVVIDASGSPYAARAMRMTIEKELGRSDFKYVINTHHHWDHSWGNQVFAEATIIGHEGCVEANRADARQVPKVVLNAEQRVANLRSTLEGLESGTDEARNTRWIEVLEELLDGDDEVKHVIPGHRKLWSRAKLAMWRGYIVDLWEHVQSARPEGLSIDTVLERYPLEKKFDYLRGLGHADSELASFHESNVRAFSIALIIPPSFLSNASSEWRWISRDAGRHIQGPSSRHPRRNAHVRALLSAGFTGSPAHPSLWSGFFR